MIPATSLRQRCQHNCTVLATSKNLVRSSGQRCRHSCTGSQIVCLSIYSMPWTRRSGRKYQLRKLVREFYLSASASRLSLGVEPTEFRNQCPFIYRGNWFQSPWIRCLCFINRQPRPAFLSALSSRTPRSKCPFICRGDWSQSPWTRCHRLIHCQWATVSSHNHQHKGCEFAETRQVRDQRPGMWQIPRGDVTAKWQRGETSNQFGTERKNEWMVSVEFLYIPIEELLMKMW